MEASLVASLFKSIPGLVRHSCQWASGRSVCLAWSTMTKRSYSHCIQLSRMATSEKTLSFSPSCSCSCPTYQCNARRWRSTKMIVGEPWCSDSQLPSWPRHINWPCSHLTATSTSVTTITFVTFVKLLAFTNQWNGKPTNFQSPQSMSFSWLIYAQLGYLLNKQLGISDICVTSVRLTTQASA